MMYVDAFGVPVVYVNSRGSLEYMPGMMGAMMKKHGFRMNGMSRIYGNDLKAIETGITEAVGAEAEIVPHKRTGGIRFYGQDILPGDWFFKHLIMKPDAKAGVRSYEAHKSDILDMQPDRGKE